MTQANRERIAKLYTEAGKENPYPEDLKAAIKEAIQENHEEEMIKKKGRPKKDGR